MWYNILHMALTIALRQGGQVGLDKTPDNCPICHLAITPIEQSLAFESEVNRSRFVDRVLQCPSAKCQRIFVARYVRRGSSVFELESCFPVELVSATQSETISSISPDFCRIHEQASKAEQYGLVLIAGPGFRKSLEFLIKDYIISQFTEDDPAKKAAHKTTVEKQQLASCIAEYIKSDQIKEISKRAAWLGNDETHYVRKWEGKDLQDLKKLISLTLHWIEAEKLTADIIKDMPE
jgi:hypothetical protein